MCSLELPKNRSTKREEFVEALLRELAAVRLRVLVGRMERMALDAGHTVEMVARRLDLKQ